MEYEIVNPPEPIIFVEDGYLMVPDYLNLKLTDATRIDLELIIEVPKDNKEITTKCTKAVYSFFTCFPFESYGASAIYIFNRLE